jgi:acetyl-CoA carboxylase biotin carboxyl carrier protein
MLARLPPAAAAPTSIPVAVHGAVAAVVEPHPPAQAVRTEDSAQDGTVTIEAPLMGRFYAKPEPGAAPFVSVGTEVNADSTVGLIEVMKVFTAVRAGVSGVVAKICVQDAEFIELGRVLFRVRVAATASAAGRDGVKTSRRGGRS